jgi:hypothetical protein
MVLYAYICCVCVFSLHRESLNMILGDKALIFKVVLSQPAPDKTTPWMENALTAQAMMMAQLDIGLPFKKRCARQWGQ